MNLERAVVRAEYRCLACGEPAVDPDECEHCGATEFESPREDDIEPLDDEVRVSPGAGSAPSESAAVAWECTNCGKRHVRNSPPCNRCGNASFRRVDATTAGSDPHAGVGPGDETAGSGSGPLSALPGELPEGVSVAGLALVVGGGLVALYGGFVGSRTAFYEATGRFPPAQQQLLVAGVAVAIVGVAIVLLATRTSDPALDLEE
jgi:predicted  nucleic acid-binding Zn-ribbon protein